MNWEFDFYSAIIGALICIVVIGLIVLVDDVFESRDAGGGGYGDI